MVYDGLYGVLLALHLVTALFLVGPAAIAATTSPRLVREGRADALRDAARTTRTYSTATVVVVAVGTVLALVSGDGTPEWSLGAPWISASYVLWFVALGLTHAVVVPAQAAAADALDAGTDASAAARRVLLAACGATAAWTAIVVLMVFKPGA